MRVHFNNKDEIRGYSVDVSTLAWLIVPVLVIVGLITAFIMPLIFAGLCYYYYTSKKKVSALIVAIIGIFCTIGWLSWW